MGIKSLKPPRSEKIWGSLLSPHSVDFKIKTLYIKGKNAAHAEINLHLYRASNSIFLVNLFRVDLFYESKVHTYVCLCMHLSAAGAFSMHTIAWNLLSGQFNNGHIPQESNPKERTSKTFTTRAMKYTGYVRKIWISASESQLERS